MTVRKQPYFDWKLPSFSLKIRAKAACRISASKTIVSIQHADSKPSARSRHGGVCFRRPLYYLQAGTRKWHTHPSNKP